MEVINDLLPSTSYNGTEGGKITKSNISLRRGPRSGTDTINQEDVCVFDLILYYYGLCKAVKLLFSFSVYKFSNSGIHVLQVILIGVRYSLCEV